MVKGEAKKDLAARVRYHGGDTEIVLEGIIEEPTSSILEEAFSGLVGRVSLDLRGVQRITSYGLGVLMQLLSEASKVHRIEFVACADVIVDQFQMLGFARYGRFASLFVRYHCESCGAESSILIDVKKDLAPVARNAQILAPNYPCRCGGTLRAEESLDFLAEHV